MVADQTLSKEMSDYSSFASQHCMSFCEDQEQAMLQQQAEQGQLQVAGQSGKDGSAQDVRTVTDYGTLSKESLVAMEKQCNQLCIRKMMQGFAHIYSSTQATTQQAMNQ